MEKRGYLAVFILILIGLFMGFSIAAQQFNKNSPYHSLSRISTDDTATTGVDISPTDGVIDRVGSIGENIVYPNVQLISTSPGGFAAVAGNVPYGVWTLLPATPPLPVIPATAEFAIIKYTMTTTGNTIQQCPGMRLEFMAATTIPQAQQNKVIDLGIQDMGPYQTTVEGQLIVPLRKDANGVNQGNFYFRYMHAIGGLGGGGMLPVNPNIPQPCLYALYSQGYIE